MQTLDPQDYGNALPLIHSLDFNTLFARAVLEEKVAGKVFVDKMNSPASFYIKHPYGMALLCGETDHDDFYHQLASYMLNPVSNRIRTEWLQVYPASLYSKIEGILGANLIKKDPDESYDSVSLQEEEQKKVLEYQRINFVFKPDKYGVFKESLLARDFKILKTSESLFNQIDGIVVPKNFWNNASDFIKGGIGFTLFSDRGLAASTAFSSFVIGNQLEIGIETSKEHQGAGFATTVCAALIDFCIASGYEPVWACSSGNWGSRKLANKLGFEEFKRVPYYRLP